MRYWFNTKFIDDGETIDLISIGIVAEDGRELYAMLFEFDQEKADEWVKTNILSHFPPRPASFDMQALQQRWMTQDFLRQSIIDFCDPFYGRPEFWGYHAAYHWVAFCQIFGSMMELPQHFPLHCCDIKQECDRLGNPELPEQGKGAHNALEDARWNQKAWQFLMNSHVAPIR